MEFKDLKIGTILVDKQGFKDTVLELTSNSVLISRKKRTKESINCQCWFSFDKNFQKEFAVVA